MAEPANLPPPQVDATAVAAPDLLAAATCYVNAGLSVIPISADGSKSPAWRFLPKIRKSNGEWKHSWYPYQSRRPTPAEIESWYSNWGPPCGLAVIGGDISGGLEIIDFDTMELFEPWRELVASQNTTVLDRLVLVQSPRPGMHVYYRTIVPTSNYKLATRIEMDPETGMPRKKTL
ncbi:MAG: bifunctional DNA primase/polymerase, partial [Planctomycetaceae bacterium]|nr:bifunctional DNA primase/polymerase [Planctomycetaceae bacterium]